MTTIMVFILMTSLVFLGGFLLRGRQVMLSIRQSRLLPMAGGLGFVTSVIYLFTGVELLGFPIHVLAMGLMAIAIWPVLITALLVKR